MDIPSMQELLSAGVHFGHQVRRGHPRMKNYIYGARDGVHIIDLALAEEKLQEAADAAREYGKQGKIMLVVGTKKQAKEILKSLSTEAGLPYLVERWVGGLLTNFDEVKRNINKLLDLKKQKEAGELSRYTKKEQLLISRKLEKFDRELGGIADMNKVPDVLFIVDAVSNNVAVREATKMGIPIIGLCDTNADPNWFSYPVPANDDGIKSIKLVCETLLKSFMEGKKELGVKNEELRIKEEKKVEEETLDAPVAEEAAAIEEEIEKKILDESERKVE